LAETVIVEDLYRGYSGKPVLQGVSFTVGESEIFGLIGPNGAGKTTTLRILVGLLRPESGRVSVLGYEPWSAPEDFKRMISYLPEEAGVYKHLTGRDYLRLLAGLYSSSPMEMREMIEYAETLSGLGRSLDAKMSTYSKGMKRRLLLAATLMTRPRLAVLDEPTSGLDVYYSVAMRKAIKEYVENTGASVILSSHNMLEVEYLCDRVAFLGGGRIVAAGTPRELREKYDAGNLEEAYIRAVGGIIGE